MAECSLCSTSCCGGRGGGSVTACSTALGRVGDPAGARDLPHMSHTRAAPSLFSYVQWGHAQTMMRYDHFRAVPRSESGGRPAKGVKLQKKWL
jgi:hypothetical protein